MSDQADNKLIPFRSESNILTHFDRAREELDVAATVDEVKKIRDKAEALRQYAKQSRLSLDMQNRCAEIRIRAERRGGDMLREMEKHPPGPIPMGDRSHDATDLPPRLEDLGILKSQSSRWQLIASIPEEQFEDRVESLKASGRELTSTEMLRLAGSLRREKEREDRRHNCPTILDYEAKNGWINKIHLGDCIEIMDQMPAESIDLIVTSPPYNLRNSSGGGMRNGNGGLWKNAELLNGYAGGNTDDMPYEDYVNWQRSCLDSMMRLLKDDGAIFYNHKWRVQKGLLQDRHDIVQGFPVRQIIIWERSGGFNFNLQYYLPTYEVIYLICKPDFTLTGEKASEIGDVWRIDQERKNPHPSPFPVDIPKRCIETTGAKIVLDPFIGSGTTAVAAKLLGVDWIGIEISEQYCQMANERLSAQS